MVKSQINMIEKTLCTDALYWKILNRVMVSLNFAHF